MNELTINLHTASETPLYEQIYQHIKREIQEGRITSGEKLPSSRSLCKYLEVSRSTVELAYEQLISEGMWKQYRVRVFRGRTGRDVSSGCRSCFGGSRRKDREKRVEI